MRDDHAVASQPIFGDRTLCDALPLVSASAPHELIAAVPADTDLCVLAVSAVTIRFDQLPRGFH
jgi:hypothetical protein